MKEASRKTWSLFLFKVYVVDLASSLFVPSPPFLRRNLDKQALLPDNQR